MTRKSKQTIEVDDEVSVKYQTSWEDAYVHKILDGQVWLRHHREIREGDKAFGPFDLKTGLPINNGDDWLGRLKVLFDYGWKSQHEEDLFLGEGETL